MKRIFIAIRIIPEKSLLSMISSYKLGLKGDNIKWTDDSNMHITLVFIGDTPEERIREIDTILKEVCSGSGEFELVISGSGVFKSIKDPRVLWTGIVYSEEMNRLQKILVRKLRENGTELEKRPYSPHLTLGRIKKINDPDKLITLLDEYWDHVTQRVKVSEIILYESILHPEGPIYKPLGKYSLL